MIYVRIFLIALFIGNLSTIRGEDAGIAFFEKSIRPVLIEQCYRCHSEEAKAKNKLKGGLLLDSKAGLLRGGDSGPAIVPGKPEKSLLLQAMRFENDMEMPPSGKLPDPVIKNFEQWIKMNAPDPREGANITTETIQWDVARKFWAFQPPVAAQVPDNESNFPSYNEVDQFINAQLLKQQLTPVEKATKYDLLRRASFDLTGLPPDQHLVEQFEKDSSPDAFQKVVEQLLNSPHYGERWARYWLDVARFAEDQAHTFGVKPFTEAYRYRDWVVQAFNEDMPYDEFAKLQIAGDLYSEYKDQPLKQFAGLGYLGLGHLYYKNSAAAQAAADELDDRIDTLTRGFLGLTVSCARCHDHKFDPIPTVDYYSLAGIYNGTNLQPVSVAPAQLAKAYAEAQKTFKDHEKMLNDWLKETAKKYKEKSLNKDQEKKLLSAEEQKHLQKLRDELEAKKNGIPPKPPEVHAVTGSGKTMKVYVRGNPANQGALAPKRMLQILPESAPPGEQFGRKELAEAIANPKNPLTARVIVNRVWQYHFGTGIVATPSNFGKLGDRPTHPELLDWLAVNFMKNGWSIKWLHRTIMQSATYQRATTTHVGNNQRDADNKYLWRMNRRRLDIEAWRDTVLAISGKLDRTVGGPSHDVSNAGNYRRTIYAKVSRHRLDPTLNLFDYPDPNITSAVRPETTIPQQQLFVLNSPFFLEQAKAFAARFQVGMKTDEDTIRNAYHLAYGRQPKLKELELIAAFVAQPSSASDRLNRWEQVAQMLLATNELMYVN
ncbi:MAG: PSD1 and planctomycete cytochrome C domain-containing protein [Zavarzinella sp.]